MKVLVCGGQVTNLICQVIDKHPEWGIEPTPDSNVIRAVQTLMSTGLNHDKIMMLGEAFEGISDDAIEGIFRYLSAIASDFQGQQEFIFVNKNSEKIDYEQLFLRYFRGIRKSRFIPLQSIPAKTMDRIIVGGYNIEPDSEYLSLKKIGHEQAIIRDSKDIYGVHSEYQDDYVPEEIDDGMHPTRKYEEDEIEEEDGFDPDSEYLEEDDNYDEGYDESEDQDSDDFEEEENQDSDDSEEEEEDFEDVIPAKQVKPGLSKASKLGGLFNRGNKSGKSEKPSSPAKEAKKSPNLNNKFKSESKKGIGDMFGKTKNKQEKVNISKEPIEQAPQRETKKKSLFSRPARDEQPENSFARSERDGMTDSRYERDERPTRSESNFKTRLSKDSINKEYNIPSNKFKVKVSLIEEMLRRHRVVLVTGNERSGKSGVVANLGMIASMCGIRTLIMDLDVHGRGQSLYFQSQLNPEDSYHTAGIMNAIRTPYKASNFVVEITDYLDMLGVDLTVADVRTISQGITGAGIVELLGHVRDSYDLIILDMQFFDMPKYQNVLGAVDKVIYTTENDISSMVNIVNRFQPEWFAGINDYQLFRSKCGFVINRYNPASTMEENLIEPANFTLFLDDIVHGYDFTRYPVYGTIETVRNYCKQFDGGVLLCESRGFDQVFFDILYVLYK